MKRMLQNAPAVAAVPGIGTETPCSSQITLTVIETATRSVVSVRDVADHSGALKILKGLGKGYDGHIRTPKYSELILQWQPTD